MRLTLLSSLSGFLLLCATGAAAEPIVVATGTSPAPPRHPQVAVAPSGLIHMVFGRGNQVLYSRSKSSGTALSFSKPVTLPGEYVLALGKRRGPRIAISGDAVAVAFIGGKEGRGRDGDVLVCTTTDGGTTWHGPTRVNDVSGSAREGLHALAAGPKGELACAWLDLRSGQMEIYGATSRDGGQTWSEDVLVYRSPDGNVCTCCHPSVAYDPNGKLFVMWRNDLAGNRDMYFAASSDAGQSFGIATKLGTGAWPLDACPMDGGYLAVSHRGDLFTAWQRDGSVFLTAPGNDELRLGAGSQPWIAASASGPYVTWLEDRTGRLLLKGPSDDKPAVVDEVAVSPMIAAAAGEQHHVVLAWERPRADGAEVVCLVIDP